MSGGKVSQALEASGQGRAGARAHRLGWAARATSNKSSLSPSFLSGARALIPFPHSALLSFQTASTASWP